MAPENKQVKSMQMTTAMKVISLRGVPDDLHRMLKVFASASGMGFRDYCVAVLEKHVEERSREASTAKLFLPPVEI